LLIGFYFVTGNMIFMIFKIKMVMYVILNCVGLSMYVQV